MRRLRRGAMALAVWGALAAGTGVVGSLAAAGALTATGSLPTTVRFSTSGSFPLPGDGSVPVQVTATGALNLVADSASITLHVPGSVAAGFEGGSDEPATVKVLMSKATLYISYPGLTSFTGGKPWIAVTEGTPASEAGLYELIREYVGELGAELGTETSSDVHRLGASVVDGVKATGYLFEYHTSVNGLSKRWMWASDATKQLVEIKLALAPPKGAPTDGATQFFDYGSPVSVTPPAASAVKAEPVSVLEKYLSLVDGIISTVF